MFWFILYIALLASYSEEVALPLHFQAVDIPKFLTFLIYLMGMVKAGDIPNF